MTKTTFNIRIEESEMELLEAYCKQTGRTKTDVVREMIRALKRKIAD
jgi:predicted DNA-binding protein